MCTFYGYFTFDNGALLPKYEIENLQLQYESLELQAVLYVPVNTNNSGFGFLAVPAGCQITEFRINAYPDSPGTCNVTGSNLDLQFFLEEIPGQIGSERVYGYPGDPPGSCVGGATRLNSLIVGGIINGNNPPFVFNMQGCQNLQRFFDWETTTVNRRIKVAVKFITTSEPVDSFNIPNGILFQCTYKVADCTPNGTADLEDLDWFSEN
jgi:hypothetical protein